LTKLIYVCQIGDSSSEKGGYYEATKYGLALSFVLFSYFFPTSVPHCGHTFIVGDKISRQVGQQESAIPHA
jgi:hypothetical protein